MSDAEMKALLSEVEEASREHDKLVGEINRTGGSDELHRKREQADRREENARKKLDAYMRSKKD
jgi:hypothetical protein